MPELVCTEPEATADVAYKPEWHERSVVFRQPAGNVLFLDAWQYGTLVVHATWHDSRARAFTVAHLHTLLVACRCATFEEAVSRAEWLWSQCPRAWGKFEVNRALVPADVIQWCRENV